MLLVDTNKNEGRTIMGYARVPEPVPCSLRARKSFSNFNVLSLRVAVSNVGIGIRNVCVLVQACIKYRNLIGCPGKYEILSSLILELLAVSWPSMNYSFALTSEAHVTSIGCS